MRLDYNSKKSVAYNVITKKHRDKTICPYTKSTWQCMWLVKKYHSVTIMKEKVNLAKMQTIPSPRTSKFVPIVSSCGQCSN